MVTLQSPQRILPRGLRATAVATSYAHCGIVYQECSRCGSYVGAQNGDGFYGSVACICLDCQGRSSRLSEPVSPVKTGVWSYGVPSAGVRYYGFR